jgi:hypothetical protein
MDNTHKTSSQGDEKLRTGETLRDTESKNKAEIGVSFIRGNDLWSGF